MEDTMNRCLQVKRILRFMLGGESKRERERERGGE